MSTIDIKKTLLAGTAILAVGIALPSAAMAQTAVDVDGPGEWGSDGVAIADNGTVAGAAAGANADISADGATLTITNDGTNNDGSANTNTFDVGALTDSSTAQDGALSILTDSANDLTVTLDSVSVGGNVAVSTVEANDGAVDVTVAGDVTVGGTLDVTNLDTDDADTVGLSVGDDLDVTGLTTVTGAAGGDATLTVSDDANFGGGLVLDDDTGNANLVLDGTTTQTVSGDIDGDGAGEGTVRVTNTSSGGVTFQGKVGDSGGNGINDAILDDAGGDVNATFQDDVTVGGDVIVGSGNGNTATATFDTSGGDIAVSGTVIGDAGSTSNVTVSGGNKVTTDADWGAGGNLDTVTVGSNTTLSAADDVTATTIQLSNGSVLQATAANKVFTANIEGGSGTLDIDADTTVDGNIGATTALSSITIAETAALTIDDTANGAIAVRATTITLEDALSDGNDAALNLDPDGATTTITADIVTQIDGEGVITINDAVTGGGTVAIVGDIGTSSIAVGDLNVSGAGTNETVTTTGNLYIDNITLDDADDLQFIATSGSQMVSGAIDGLGGATDGNVTVGTGTQTNTVTFNGLLGDNNNLGSFNVGTGSTAIFAAAGTNDFDGVLDQDGTIQINSGATLDIAGAYDSTGDADAGTWNIGLTRTGGADAIGIYTSAGAQDFSADTVHILIEAGTQPLVDGTVINNVLTGATVTEFGTLTDNSFLFDFTLTDVGADNDLDLTITANPVSSAVSNDSLVGVGDALLTDLAASTNTQINQLQGQVQSQPTAEGVNDVLEAAGPPTIDAGAVVAAVGVVNQTSNLTDTRLASLRAGSGETGMVAGNISQGLSIWAEVFGSTGDQDDRDGVSGFEADTYGVAVGIDTESLAEDWVWGLAFAYADTEVDSKGLANAKTEIDSYQLSVYSQYDWDDRTYVTGQVGYVWAENDTSRNPGGVAGLSAVGDYDSNQYFARVEVGRDYVHGETTLTPKALLNYMHYDADSFTETGNGAGGANLSTDSDSLNLLEIGVGVDASWMHKHSDGSYLKPKVDAGVRYDVIGDEYETTSTFAAGGSAFETDGFDPAQATFNVGAGVTYYSTTNWELTAEYDFEIKSDYDAHAGLLRAGYRF